MVVSCKFIINFPMISSVYKKGVKIPVPLFNACKFHLFLVSLYPIIERFILSNTLLVLKKKCYMKKFLPLSVLLAICIFSHKYSFGADRFWVGGAGNWGDVTQWSTTSGGAGGATVPGTTDDAIFDGSSGLIVTDIVVLNVAVDIQSFDFSALPISITFNSTGMSFAIRGSINGNVSGVAFSGTWIGIDLNTTLTGEVISSGGTIWVQDFVTNGEQISLLDDFNIGTNSFQIDSGGVDMNGNTFTCGAFVSGSIGVRDIDISNSTINVGFGYWTIDSTNLTWTSGGSEIFFGDDGLGNGVFEGGSLPYDTLRSISATNLYYAGNNSFDLFELIPSSTFKMNNADTLSVDSLIANGSCTSQLTISTIAAGVNGVINKTGGTPLSLAGLHISNVDAAAPEVYNITFSEVYDALGWTLSPTDYYWIGNGGDWNDFNHWSFSSGGGVAGCLPDISDSVFFDLNSFSLTGQEVVVDDTAYFGAMHWVGIFGNQTLSLDSTIWAYGDVVLHPNLTVQRNVISAAILFNDQADLFPNNAAIDCSFLVTMPTTSESLRLQGDLVMSDSSSIILFNGEFTTESFGLKTGTIFSSNDPTSGVDGREISFGSSDVEIVLQFNSLGDTNLVFNAGTSQVYIGDTNSFDNSLSTEGIIFYDVTLNFQPLNIGSFPLLQAVKGANTFNKLEVVKGSHVYLESGVVQTVNDSLIFQGDCLDSIFIQSLDTSVTNVQALINKISTTDIVSECVNVGGINFVNPSITTFFSTNLGNNSNWIFSATNATDANFTFTGPGGILCFGDTVFFTNTSTAFSGNVNDLDISWTFNDDTLGFVSDTNAHVFNGSGDFNVTLQTMYTNFCESEITQVVTVNRPIVYLNSTEFDLEICANDAVTFEASSPAAGTAFEFFVNGTSVLGPGVNDTLYITSGLFDGDTISVQSSLGGCYSDSIPQQVFTVNPLPVFTMTSTDADTSICAGDFVSFSGVGGEVTSLYQYQLNGGNVTSLTLNSTYNTTTLVDNDVITLISESIDGCLDSSQMIFNVDALPTTSLTSSELGTIICEGTNVTYTASGATSYEFFINGASQGAASATATFSTIMTVSETVAVIGYFANGCSFLAPETFNYSIIATPSISLTSSDIDLIICSGENVSFNVSGGVNYEFFIDGVSQGATSPISNFSTSGLTNGQTVTATGDLGGCLGTSTGILFTVIPSPTTVITSSDANDIICQGESVTFTGSGATNYEFLIDGVSQGISSPTNTFTTSTLINGQTITLNGESNACIVQDQLTYTVLPSPSVSLFSDDSDNTICDGESITFTSGSAATYQMYVDGSPFGPAQGLGVFTNPALPIGTSLVYVEGTSSNGCTSTSLPAISVTVNPIPVVTNTSSDLDDIICAGELVTFTGAGSNLFQFFIDGVAQTTLSSNSTFSTTSLSNGEIIDIVGSSLGCVSSSNAITMTVNAVPIVSLSNNDPNNIWCSDEIVTFTASGAPSYEFLVDGVSQGISSPTNTINSATFAVGSYTVEVLGEQASCFGSASMGIVVNPLPVPTLLSSDADDIICNGESVTYTAGGGVTYEFFVDGVSQGTTSAIDAFTSSTLADGNVVSVVVTSGSGCTESTVGNALTVNPTPPVTLVSSDIDFTICVGESVTFTGAGASDFEFFVNGASQGLASATTTFSTSTLANGDVVGVTGSLLGCTNSPTSLTFTVFDYPIVSLVNNGDIQICSGELTDVTAFGATNYQFLVNGTATGPFSSSATLNTALLDGDVVTVTGELNGCPTTSTDSYTFTVFDFPTLTSTSSDADNIICLDELISFTGFGAMTYDFALNGDVLQSGSTPTFDISTLLDGDVISITGFNGDCPSTNIDSYVFTVNSMNLDLIASPSNLICEGDAVTFTASGGDNYEFFLNGASTGAMSTVNTFASSTLNDLDEITFIAENVTTVCTQSLSDYIIMNVIDEPSIVALSATDFCEGDSVVLVSEAAHGNQWYLDGAIIPGATDTSYVAFTSGVYSVETTSGGIGTVWSFGQNASGTIGNGENLNSADPAVSVSTETFDELTSGYDFILGVTTTGELFGWGDNTSGQLGDGTYTSTNIPQVVPTLSGVKTAATSESSSMAVAVSGDVYVWGNNSQGQLGTGNTSVINFPFLNASLANTDSIAGGRDHFIILKNDGTVWAVGNNDFGQLGQGDLVASSNAVQVPGLTNVVSVGAGEYQSFAIDNAGDLYVWGNNGSGQLGLGDLNNRLDPTLSGLEDIINAQGGASHSAFLSSNNKVYTAGSNGFGQLGTTTLVDETSPFEVDIQGATMISTGQYTTLVKRTDNTVFGFGNNTEDQLSSLTGLTVSTPEHIEDLDGVNFIEAGKFTSHVIYNEDQACVSPGVTVNMLAAPIVTITVDVDTLTATAGASYQWYLDGSVIPSATSQTHVVNATGDYYVEVTFANGCVGTSSTHAHSAVGIDELTFGRVMLYPNPAKNQVNLTFSTDVQVNTEYIVTDQMGRIVIHGQITSSNVSLDISELENGMYSLIISNEAASRSLRFVKSLN